MRYDIWLEDDCYKDFYKTNVYKYLKQQQENGIKGRTVDSNGKVLETIEKISERKGCATMTTLRLELGQVCFDI